MMKIVLVLLLAAVAAGERPLMAYHEDFGIPTLAKIKQYEQGRDFDGSRIVGGTSVSAGTQPHLGGIFINLADGRSSICGASLLTNTRAVTAAHCWSDGQLQAVQFTIVYGSAFLFSGGFRVPTNQVVMHENWNPWLNAQHDIAIVTHIWVGFNNNINRILLPSGALLNEIFAGVFAVAAGYGRVSDDALTTPANPDKRQVSLQVMTNAACQQFYSPETHVFDTTLCTSGAGGRNVCNGDSGGPLAVGSGNNRVLIGITSFGVAQCSAGWPAAFTRVTAYVPWILARI